jgi:hypothetical protein
MDLTYKMIFTCGETGIPSLPGVKFVDVTPAEATAEAVLARVTEAGVTGADMKSDVLVVLAPEADQTRSLVVYAAIAGLAGRRVDVGVHGTIINAEMLEARVQRTKDAGQPPVRPVHVQIGATGRTDIPEIPIDQLPNPQAMSLVRYAKRVRMVPEGDTLAAVKQLLIISAARSRRDEERYPFLVDGTEPAVELENAWMPVGIDLEQVRRDAIAMRRTTRLDDRTAIVEAAELTERQQRLVDAAAVPVELALTALGSTYDADAEAWTCPRADRHPTNDTGPTVRVAKDKARCVRCDAERVDALRLVFDVTGCSPDEAADWLLARA